MLKHTMETPRHSIMLVVGTILGCLLLQVPMSASYVYEYQPQITHGPHRVSAIYSFGDSTIDVGNNNYLNVTGFAKADVAPYGRDFDTHLPTGRYSNGRLVVDFLAAKLKLEELPSPFLAMGNNNFTHHIVSPGVNFASSDSGILTPTGREFGSVLRLEDQVNLFREKMVPALLNMLGNDVGRAAFHLRNSLFIISTGSNDFLTMDELNRFNFLGPPAGLLRGRDFDASTYNHEEMYDALWEQISGLYREGARKFVIMEIGALGCTPNNLVSYNSRHGECYAPLNNQVQSYNLKMAQYLATKFAQAPGSAYVIAPTFDALKAIASSPQDFEFKHNAACCGEGPYKGLPPCLSNTVCEDANQYVWFDAFHPSQQTYSILADQMWETLKVLL